MGYYNNGVVNSYHRDLAQWLGDRIQTVTSNGTYTLTPTGVADSGLKAIRIPRVYDAVTNSTTYYYIEFRQPVGYDSFLSSYPGVTNGVLLHQGTIGTDVNKIGLGSELLDGTPTVSGANQALAVGQSFTDPAIPVTVTVLSANSAGVTVSVQFDVSTCAPVNPTVLVTSSTTCPVAPGTLVPYTVTVTNNDSSSCGPASFDLQASVPNGWTASFASPTLTVSAGASASTTLTVGSPVSAGNGSYNIGVTATNGGSSAYYGSTAGVYTVASSLAVSVSTDRQSYNRKQSVVMTASVSANGSPVQGAVVNLTMTKSNGALVTQSVTTGSNGSAVARFQLRKPDPPGNYQGRGTASAGNLSGTAITSFTVQ
jgi:hypothetical protein